MLRKITIFGTELPMFSVMSGIGIFLLLMITLLKLRKKASFEKEVFYIIPKLVISLLMALGGAILFDALVKIPSNGGFKISGITFYGGLITGLSTMIILLIIFKKNTNLSVIEWLDFLTIPFIIFHICGRIGCFCAGCCYGSETNSFLGILFPDVPENDIYHHNHKVYPTQLFEVALLIIILIIIKIKKKYNFYIYGILYPLGRFGIEFFRGDNRGSYLLGLSPSQFVSIILILILLSFLIIRKYKKNYRIE